jgi:hypothetical protein
MMLSCDTEDKREERERQQGGIYSSRAERHNQRQVIKIAVNY